MRAADKWWGFDWRIGALLQNETNMAEANKEYVRNTDWKFDNELEETIKCLVVRNFKRSEILDFLKRDFPDYSWSLKLASLSRRMKYFDIKYTDYSTTVEQVRAAFQEENNGPGQLLGYRAMHKQIREKHGLAVPRGLVYDVMTLDDEDGLQRRKAMGKEKRKRGPVGAFTSLVG